MTDEAESRIAFLKDAFARISAAPFDDREALTKEFAQEFQRRDPETAAKLKRWGGDGWFLRRACEIALESALVRTDLTADEKRKTLSDGWHCVAALKAAVSPEFPRSPSQSYCYRFRLLRSIAWPSGGPQSGGNRENPCFTGIRHGTFRRREKRGDTQAGNVALGKSRRRDCSTGPRRTTESWSRESC